MNESLKNCVKKIKKLPTLPVIAQEVLSLVSNDLTTVHKIERVVENDPAISAKILSVANSVLFGVKVRTRSLDNAIMRIGLNNVKSIAMGISLMTVLQNGERGGALDYKRLYNHSITAGFIARLFAKSLKLDFSEEIMINGMLHDLGYLVLNKYFPDSYRDVLHAFNEGASLIEAEKNILGFTHAEIGKWLAGEWNLPNPVLDTTAYHHDPSGAKRNLKRVAVIHISDYVTTRKMLSPTEKDPDYPFDYASLDILDIGAEDIREFENKISGEAYSDEVF